MAGVKIAFPKAKDISKMVISDYKYAFVWGPNAPVDKLTDFQLIVLSPFPDQISDKSKWTIAGRTPAEKHGSFTNSENITQAFRRALKGKDNFDDLVFFVDILNSLDVKPIGRTVQEVRASF
jgi:hypothetical protein